MDIKKNYAIALDNNGEFLKIKKKAGIEKGQTIFVLEEDILGNKKKEHTFFQKYGLFSRKELYVAAVLIIVFVVVYVDISKSTTANADSCLYIEGDYGVELELNDKDEITNVKIRKFDKDGDIKPDKKDKEPAKKPEEKKDLKPSEEKEKPAEPNENNTDNADTEIKEEAVKPEEPVEPENSSKWIGKNIDEVIGDIVQDINKNGDKDISYSATGKKKDNLEKKVKKSIH